MKRILALLVILLGLLAFAGCASKVNKVAYVTSEAGFVLYDAAMKSLADMKNAGTITADQWEEYGIGWGGKVRACGIAFDTAMYDYNVISEAFEALGSGETGTVTLSDGTTIEVTESNLANYYGLAKTAAGLLISTAAEFVTLLTSNFGIDLDNDLVTLVNALNI